MQPDSIFSIGNLVAMTGWILLTVAPRWKVTRTVVLSGLIPLLLGAAYLILVALFFGKSEGSFGTLSGVMTLFQNPWAVLAGWIHYLAFDLFVGSWEVRDSERHGISHFLVIPCLFLTFMLGPVGLLVYFIIRGIKTKQVLHDNFGGDKVTG
jgi:hypothetical protein